MHDANPFAFQDLPNAMNAAEITDKLGLHSLRNRNWYIQVNPTTSLSGIYMKQHFLTYGTLCCTAQELLTQGMLCRTAKNRNVSNFLPSDTTHLGQCRTTPICHTARQKSAVS
jgi:hypothetical protein